MNWERKDSPQQKDIYSFIFYDGGRKKVSGKKEKKRGSKEEEND